MIINKLHIDGFGHFKNIELILDSSFNVISGSNEYGKTTIFVFIRAMFFGLKGTKKEIKADYDRYLPIDSPSNFGGSMFVTHKGCNYKITRNLYKNSRKFTLINIDDNTTLTEDEWLELLEPINFDIFTSTCYINSETTNPGPDFMKELQSRIVALAESNSNNIRVRDTKENIKSKLKNINRSIKNLPDIDKYKLLDAKSITEKNIEELDNEINSTKYIKPSITASIVFSMLAALSSLLILVLKPLYVILIALCFALAFILMILNYSKKAKAYNETKINVDYIHGRIEELKNQLVVINNKINDTIKIENEYKTLEFERKSFELALSTIDEISKEIYTNNTDLLNEKLSQTFTEITNNSYKGVFIDDNMIIRGVRHDNTLYELNKFSHGTLEQLYLSLRMVVLDMIYNDYPLPIILDDAFVHYDYKRYKNALAALSKCNHQIIIFNLSKNVL